MRSMPELKLSSRPPNFPIPRTTKPHSRRPSASVSIRGAPYRSSSCRRENRSAPPEEEPGAHLPPSRELLGQGFRSAEQGGEDGQVPRARNRLREVLGREGVAQLRQAQEIQGGVGRRPGPLEQRFPRGIRPGEPLPDLLQQGKDAGC